MDHRKFGKANFADLNVQPLLMVWLMRRCHCHERIDKTRYRKVNASKSIIHSPKKTPFWILFKAKQRSMDRGNYMFFKGVFYCQFCFNANVFTVDIWLFCHLLMACSCSNKLNTYLLYLFHKYSWICEDFHYQQSMIKSQFDKPNSNIINLWNQMAALYFINIINESYIE